MALENPTVAPYAGMGECIIRVTARADNEALCQQLMEPVVQEIRQRLPQHYYGEGEESLEDKTARLLLEKGLTIATAESLSGGLLASALIDCSLGISASFREGYITYSNEAKIRDLGVLSQTLERHGAVSEECAREMVLGCQGRSGTDVAIATTGIAGPSGGSAQKPVGLTYIALYYKGEVQVFREIFRGPRNVMRRRVVRFALDKLLRKLETEAEQSPGNPL